MTCLNDLNISDDSDIVPYEPSDPLENCPIEQYYVPPEDEFWHNSPQSSDTFGNQSPLYQNQEGDPQVQNILWNEMFNS